MNNRKISDTDLVIKFPNKKAAKNFALWLSESGEQDYWLWMEYREQEDNDDITAVQFHYHGEEDQTVEETDPARCGKFMEDNVIRTTMGRLSK